MPPRPATKTRTNTRLHAKCNRERARHIQPLPRGRRNPPHPRRLLRRQHGQDSTRSLTLRASRTTLKMSAERVRGGCAGMFECGGPELVRGRARHGDHRRARPCHDKRAQAAQSCKMHDMRACRLATLLTTEWGQLAAPPVGLCGVG